jgi:D-alanyl-D-alanine carboxypeptidase
MGDLLFGLMLRSANDAAAAIAYEISGSIEAFADKMNEKAESLGLTDTHFTNPHGLDDKEHYTTARELAIITGEALKNDTFLQIVSTKKQIITNSDGESRLLINHNKLLNMYENTIGVKTGFTKKSGRCLVGAAERDGVRLITVTINAPDDWKDHTALFDYGFSKLKTEPAVTKLITDY